MRRSWVILGGCVFLAIAMRTPVMAQGIRPSETYLPNTTAGMIWLSHPATVVAEFRKTQIGTIVYDPVMEPFRKDVRRQYEDRIANLKDHLAITIDDLESVSGGEAAIASIRPAPGVSALGLVADVSGRIPQAEALLAKIDKNFIDEGAKRIERSAAGSRLLLFELPEPKGEDKDLEGAEKQRTPPRIRQAVYCLVGNLLLASDRLDIIEGMLRRMAQPREDSLAADASFKYVMARCAADAGDQKPQIRWYIQPHDYADVVRTNTPPHKRRKGKSLVQIMEEQGFTGVKGMGGFVSFAAEGTEVIHRTAVYAPKPWEVSMKMIDFKTATDCNPQSWVPREIATYTTFYFDVVTAFDNFGPLYGEISGVRDPHAWIDAVESLKIDLKGPRVDLRAMVEQLGPRITAITDYQLPITTTSERLLFALETKDESAVARAIDRIMAAEPAAVRRNFEGQIIWELVPEQVEADLPDVSLPSIGGADKEKKAPDPEAKLLPHAAMIVTNGHLYYASHIDFLIKVLEHIKSPDLLTRDAAWQAVDKRIEQFDVKDRIARSFSFTDEEYGPTYELMRVNKLPEAETLFARALNRLSGTKKGQLRQPKIDGRQLPEYQVVRRYLGPAGLVVGQDQQGWFLKGCLLTKR